MRFLPLIIALLLAAPAWCQQADGMPETSGKAIVAKWEKKLAIQRRAILNARKEAKRMEANVLFKATLDSTLALPASRNYPFDSLSPTMAVLESPDKAFRIFNWNVPSDDGTHEFFGFLQHINPRTAEYELVSLKDQSWNMDRPLNKQLAPNKWYGALYYEIIAVQLPKNKTVYTLLGWDGNNRTTQKKIVETLERLPNGDFRFGVAMVKTDKGVQRRLIFEYASDASMSLRYSERQNQIVFDHLAPRNPNLTGMFQYYGPSLSYDALKLKKGKWEYVLDVDARNVGKGRVWNKPK